MKENKEKSNREDYGVEEIEMNDNEINDLINKLQNLMTGEHIRLCINKNKEVIIHRKYNKMSNKFKEKLKNA